MRHRANLSLAAAFFVFACASGPALNQYGLPVVESMAAYERTVRGEPGKRLVDVRQFVPGVVLDVRYASENNFMKRRLYPVEATYLRLPAALALRDVQSELAAQGVGLKIFDGYRPYRFTVEMWDAIRNPDYVADPARGSRHNRGAAVDLTLVSLQTGGELPMPTGYDDFTPRAAHAFDDLPADAKANRELLRAVMAKYAFEPLASEWWHYDFKGWEEFELLDVPLEELGTVM